MKTMFYRRVYNKLMFHFLCSQLPAWSHIYNTTCDIGQCFTASNFFLVSNHTVVLNILRTGDADLRFYVTTVQDG